MQGQPAGHDGVSGKYLNVKLPQPELYDLARDIGETTDVSAQYPELVKKLEAEAEKARAELGDGLLKRTGSGQREPGRLAEAKP